jgi:hypothetical protein
MRVIHAQYSRVVVFGASPVPGLEGDITEQLDRPDVESSVRRIVPVRFRLTPSF